MRLRDYSTLTFDCYGTLIDWESGMLAGLKRLVGQLSTPLTADEIWQAHGRYESQQQAQTPTMRYDRLLAVVYKRLAEAWGIKTSWDDCLKYGQSAKSWRPFPDSAEALAYLSQHFKLVILSNVDNETFAASAAQLGVNFDAVFTAEDIGSYKPSDNNFSYMIRNLQQNGVEPDQILHTAESLFHDHMPAGRVGLTSCWIYRRHDKKGFGATMNPGTMPDVAFTFNSLAEMVAAHQAEY